MGQRFISIPNVQGLTGQEKPKPVQWVRDWKEEENENASDIKKLLDLNESPSLTYEKQRILIESYRHALAKCINLHVRDCMRYKASNYEKSNMKLLVDHTEMCDNVVRGCHICNLVISVATEHCKHCSQIKCNVPFCGNYKFGRERLLEKVCHKKKLLSVLKNEEKNKSQLEKPVLQANERNRNLKDEVAKNASELQEWLNLYSAKSNDLEQRNLLQDQDVNIGKSIQLHIIDCQDGYPNYYEKSGMQILIDHLKNCSKKPLTCYVCDRICGFTLSHYENCKKGNCTVVFCGRLKSHEREKSYRKLLKQKQLLSSFEICPSYVPEKALAVNTFETSKGKKDEKTDEEMRNFTSKIVQNASRVEKLLNFHNSLSDDNKGDILREEYESCICESVNLHILFFEKGNLNCELPKGMEMLIDHLKSCNKQPLNCGICDQICTITLDHCKRCSKLECPVPFCRRRRLFKKEALFQKNLRKRQLSAKKRLMGKIGFQPTKDSTNLDESAEKSQSDRKLRQGSQISPIHKMLLLKRTGQRTFILRNQNNIMQHSLATEDSL